LGKRCPTPGQRFERVGGTHGCAEAHGIGIAWEPSQISVSAAIRLEERERERGRKRDGERERKREGEREGEEESTAKN
jgi:hypothetical protein